MTLSSLPQQKEKWREACHKYQCALKKYPTEAFGDEIRTFKELKVNLLLNVSRCKRKLEVRILGVRILVKGVGDFLWRGELLVN